MEVPEIIHLNRLNDVFFKSLLGSEERKALTLNFINSILERNEHNAFTAADSWKTFFARCIS